MYYDDNKHLAYQAFGFVLGAVTALAGVNKWVRNRLDLENNLYEHVIESALLHRSRQQMAAMAETMKAQNAPNPEHNQGYQAEQAQQALMDMLANGQTVIIGTEPPSTDEDEPAVDQASCADYHGGYL